MTYSEKIAVLTSAQNKIAATNSLAITDADVYRESWSQTLTQISQMISALWPSDFE